MALDPGFALPHIALASNYLLLTTGIGIVPAREAMPTGANRTSISAQLEIALHL